MARGSRYIERSRSRDDCRQVERSRSRDDTQRARLCNEDRRSRGRGDATAGLRAWGAQENSMHADWDRWEPYGSNRGGKANSRGGSPPRNGGSRVPGPWRHDLFEDAFGQHVGDITNETSAHVDSSGGGAWSPSWLPPRGLGSGRGVHNFSRGGPSTIEVDNLDPATTLRQFRSLFNNVGNVAHAWVDAQRSRGGVTFASHEDAKHAVQRFHRHPWLGKRPMNVRLER
eukprot:TRINITY_DN29701_c0_g2_i1.p1 TRINITY_DN29701_c0_g2~~TRINITY_DN29701_c0_g2_i1.p1  ORF type:complete len:228 (+),score=13.63 TRINITY_DN29701_c0_g2_i1:89-772(+)